MRNALQRRIWSQESIACPYHTVLTNLMSIKVTSDILVFLAHKMHESSLVKSESLPGILTGSPN